MLASSPSFFLIPRDGRSSYNINVMSASNRPLILLLVGDFIVFALVTMAGFATHQTLGTAGLRIASTFLPLLAAWGLIGGHVGVFDLRRASDPRQLWRPFWTMILAAPVFGLLRAWMLGVDSISATFLVVMGGISALSILAWRTIAAFWLARRNRRE